ncbi:O-methyltransferase [Marinithermofilum abyssi]|uniref:O-methyltransferase n=1 Tax=Marinithermofilum abyssi TaxID=1571185 RepID=A0A8J2VIC1_9BACL|nr:O-methyltransferase [Marinithermofilum abyssi]GGE15019.1 O-methyltransferase [Marinithermofilum abyssi]
MRLEEYIRRLFAREDEVLASIHPGLAERNMPQISVPPEVGKALYMLVKISGAHNVLEIGGLGGTSAIWMGRALPADGRILSLEINPDHAAFAEENVKRAGLADRIRYQIGDAAESLEMLEAKRAQFDFFFIDADKENYPLYVEKAIRMSTPGAIIALDNMLWKERVLDEDEQDAVTQTIRRVNERLARDDRVDATLLTIGDGLLVARVK